MTNDINRAAGVLLPCPFCGCILSVNNANLGVHPRFSECLFAQQVVVVDDPSQLSKWNTRTVPTKDFSAIVEEAVAWRVLVSGEFFYGRTKAECERERADYESTFTFEELNEEEREVPEPLYRRAQRYPQYSEVYTQCSELLRAQGKMVMPDRKRETTDESDVLIDCKNEGWNACLDEFKRLNKTDG